MQPMESIRYPVMMRVRRITLDNLRALSKAQGLRPGPFSVHVIESIAQCPPERFHAAMAAFLDEATKRR